MSVREKEARTLALLVDSEVHVCKIVRWPDKVSSKKCVHVMQFTPTDLARQLSPIPAKTFRHLTIESHQKMHFLTLWV